ncbi:unnamed protein product, partial [marine sediment metagenome]
RKFQMNDKTCIVGNEYMPMPKKQSATQRHLTRAKLTNPARECDYKNCSIAFEHLVIICDKDINRDVQLCKKHYELFRKFIVKVF